jgi:hypothetical protein
MSYDLWKKEKREEEEGGKASLRRGHLSPADEPMLAIRLKASVGKAATQPLVGHWDHR